ncbi:MAG: hypothetical protein HY701_15055 [Gemmatimonadetes bacterium]|nr:hypothetical protein [Gemmatimonadota bacterium]
MSETSSLLPPPDSPYWDANHKDHAQAVEEVRAWYVQHTADETGAPARPSLAAPAKKSLLPEYDPAHPYYDRYHPEHKAAVDAVRRAYEAEDPPPPFPEVDQLEPADHLRAKLGVSPPPLPPAYRESWDEVDEAMFLTWALRENFSASQTQAAMNWYARALVGDVGRLSTAREDEFREWAAKRFTPSQIETMVRYVRTLHEE